MRQEQDPDDLVSHLVEIRGVYDGWSVKVLKDGTAVNRWPADDYRHAATQKWIDEVWLDTGNVWGDDDA
jgi:hypothetical protein